MPCGSSSAIFILHVVHCQHSTMAEKLRVGATYADFEDLSLAIKEYEQQNNTQFVTGASKTVEKANARLPPGKQTWPGKFRYSNIVFTCKHYGVTKTTGVGMRPIQRSFKIDCPVKLIVCGERGLDRLLVTAFNSEHTHEISECVFKAYPEVIEAFLQLLAQQSNTEEKYSVILLPSQAAQMWEKRDFSWTFEKVPLAKFKLLLMPICSGAHWFLLAVHIPSKTEHIMDSIRSVSRREQYFVLWKNFLLRRNKENNELPTTGWHLSEEQSNFQADGDSCGVFVLMNAAALVNGLPTSVMRQVHVHGFRQYVLQVLCKIMGAANEERCDAKVCKLTQKSTKARWVSCDHCLRWIHYVCDKIKVKPRGQLYMCNACTA